MKWLWRNIQAAMMIALCVASTSTGQTLWESAHGPPGGYIQTLHVAVDGSVISGTAYEGVFRCVDGTSWYLIGLLDLDIRDIESNRNGTLFVATADSGVFRSADAGVTWEKINSGLPDLRVRTLAFDGVLLAGTYGSGVFRFEDDHWVEARSGLMDYDVRSLAYDEAGIAYAGTFRSGVFRSLDNGRAWTPLNGGSGLTVIRSVITENNNVYVASWNGGVYRTTREDGPWIEMNEGLPDKRVWSLRQDAAGRLYAGMHGEGVYVREEIEAQWRAAGLQDIVVRSLAGTGGDTLWAGTSSGIYRALPDRSGWEITGVPKSTVYALHKTANGTLVAATDDGGMFRSTDHGRQWVQTDLIHTDVYAVGERDNGYLFAGSTFGEVYRSDDDGLTWALVNKDPDDDWTIRPIWSLATDRNAVVYAGSAGNGVLRSDDGGRSWIKAGLEGSVVTSLAVDDNHVVYAGTIAGLYRSEDEGSSWQNVTSGLTSDIIRTVFIDRNNVVMAGTEGGGLFQSEDGGSSWEALGLDGRTVSSIRRKSADSLFVATLGEGVFMLSSDGTWQQFSAGLENPFIRTLEMTNNGRLAAGTNGDGVFLADVTSVEVEDIPILPTRLTLEQNYPNPFSGSTRFAFSLQRPGRANIRIFDLLGREVATVVDRFVRAGSHTVSWNALGFPAGVYFYRLDAVDEARTRRMVVAR